MTFSINYCEHAIVGNYFQPLNSISNIFYILAAVLLYYFYKKSKIKDAKSKIFLSLIVLIGVCSFLFHLYKNQATFFFDVLPIGIFFISYVYFLIVNISENKKAGLYWTIIFLLIMGFGFIITKSISENNLINEAQGYILTLLFFAGVIAYTYAKRISISKKLTIIFILFLLALIFRQIDLLLCNYIKTGTHFIWHLLSSITMYYSIKVLYK